MAKDQKDTETDLEILRNIEANPKLTQRQIAKDLGMSLGKTNYLIQALLKRGLVKVNNFKTSDGRSEFYKGLMLIRTDKPDEGCRILEVASRKKFILKNDGVSALLVFKQLCLNNSNN